ncbi:MAG: hypothetical protein R2851_19960 [Caldilineaceae bacterium]
MTHFIDLLVEQPLLLLFLVSAIGYVIGRIRIAGVSLGVAAILFVGLAFGALSPELSLPPVLVEMGLIIFVYTIGLSSGAGFFASFNRQGLRNNLLVLGMLTLAAGMTVAAYTVLALKPTVTAGMFAGSLTNTPPQACWTPSPGCAAGHGRHAAGRAGGGLLRGLSRGRAGDAAGRAAGAPSSASTTAPTPTACASSAWWSRRSTTARRHPQRRDQRAAEHAQSDHTWPVIFGRHERANGPPQPDGDTVLAGRLISIIGPPEGDGPVVRDLKRTDRHAPGDGSQRVRLARSSSPTKRSPVASCADRACPALRRGGGACAGATSACWPTATPCWSWATGCACGLAEDIPRLSRLFGDSYKALSELDLLTFGLGLTLGVLLGLIPIPLPGRHLQPGHGGWAAAGGVGAGNAAAPVPLVWTLPYSTSLTLRQMGPDPAVGGHRHPLGLHLRDDLWGQRQGEHLPGGRAHHHGDRPCSCCSSATRCSFPTTCCWSSFPRAYRPSARRARLFATEADRERDPQPGLRAGLPHHHGDEDSVCPVVVDVVAVTEQRMGKGTDTKSPWRFIRPLPNPLLFPTPIHAAHPTAARSAGAR